MTSDLSRRSFLGLTAALPFAAASFASAAKKVPVGLELYSVRDDLAKDLPGTVGQFKATPEDFLVEEVPAKQVRMAHLAIVGTHSTNGVAEIHSDLLKKTVVPDFAEI